MKTIKKILTEDDSIVDTATNGTTPLAASPFSSMGGVEIGGVSLVLMFITPVLTSNVSICASFPDCILLNSENPLFQKNWR